VKLRIVGRGVTDDVVVAVVPELPDELLVPVVAVVVAVVVVVVVVGVAVAVLLVVALGVALAVEAEPVFVVAAACVRDVLTDAATAAWPPAAPPWPDCPPPEADLVVPPTIPTNASTWHLTVVLAALSIVPVSVT